MKLFRKICIVAMAIMLLCICMTIAAGIFDYISHLVFNNVYPQ